jgi:hypothetical protein
MTILSAMFVIVRDENGGCQPVVRRGCESTISVFFSPARKPHFFHPPNPPIALQSITLDAASTKRPQGDQSTTGPASVAIPSRLDSPFYPLI